MRDSEISAFTLNASESLVQTMRQLSTSQFSATTLNASQSLVQTPNPPLPYASSVRNIVHCAMIPYASTAYHIAHCSPGTSNGLLHNDTGAVTCNVTTRQITWLSKGDVTNRGSKRAFMTSRTVSTTW
eukprot:3158193-Rhodomonas_salina.1